MDLVAGQFLGDLELLERAGAGGFSVVWKARRQGSGELFAVKVPQVDALVDHLRRDASFARRVDDPQVATPLEVHLDADPPHLVCRWVEGRPLPLPASAPAPEEQVRALDGFLGLVRVVGRIHDLGIVHGDLKPGNVLVDAAGVPHVLDLGLARLELEARLERSLAQSVVSVDGRSIAGTLDFMAPELFQGEKPGTAADVYSLGVVLHHLLTGRPPAFGVSPSALNPYLPPRLEDLLRRMLHHDPRARVARAGELVPEVERLLAGERRCLARRNGHARRRVFHERMKTLRRGLRALFVGTGVVAVVVGGIVVVTHASEQSQAVENVAIGVAIVGGYAGIIPLLLAITTINAWILGVPEKTYKNRAGHPIWSFMMQ